MKPILVLSPVKPNENLEQQRCQEDWTFHPPDARSPKQAHEPLSPVWWASRLSPAPMNSR